MTDQVENTPEYIHWPSIIAAISSITAVGIAIGLGLPLLSMVLESRNIPASLSGINTAMAGIAAMLASPVTTKFAHRYGVATTMMWAALIAAFSGLGFFYIENFWFWFPLRLVFHGAITTLFILSEFWINFAAPSAKRGLVLGIYSAMLSLGFAIGAAIYPAVKDQGVVPFAIGSMIIVVSTLPIFMARRENPPLDEKPQHHFLKYIFTVPTSIMGVFVFGAVQVGGVALLPVYATRLGFSEEQASFFLSTMAIGNMAFQIPLGLISDRIVDKRFLLTGMGIIGLIGALLFPYAITDWRLLATLLFFWGGVVAGLYTVGLSHIGARFHGSDLAAANAAFMFFYAVGTVAGPSAIGAGMDLNSTLGFAWVLMMFFASFVTFALYRLFFHPRRT